MVTCLLTLLLLGNRGCVPMPTFKLPSVVCILVETSRYTWFLLRSLMKLDWPRIRWVTQNMCMRHSLIFPAVRWLWTCLSVLMSAALSRDAVLRLSKIVRMLLRRLILVSMLLVTRAVPV